MSFVGELMARSNGPFGPSAFKRRPFAHHVGALLLAGARAYLQSQLIES